MSRFTGTINSRRMFGEQARDLQAFLVFSQNPKCGLLLLWTLWKKRNEIFQFLDEVAYPPYFNNINEAGRTFAHMQSMFKTESTNQIDETRNKKRKERGHRLKYFKK